MSLVLRSVFYYVFTVREEEEEQKKGGGHFSGLDFLVGQIRSADRAQSKNLVGEYTDFQLSVLQLRIPNDPRGVV
jgi:hypothetical protein